MSLAYLTTLYGIAVGVENRVVRGLDPNFLAALAESLELTGLVFAAIEPRPELLVFFASGIFRIDEHAVVLTLHFGQRIAQRVAESYRWPDAIVPSMLNSITACDLPIAAI